VKHWVAGGALLVLCASLIACKGSSMLQKSPSDVVKAFYAAANEGRYSDVKVFFSEGGKKLLDSDMAQLAGGIKGLCDKATKDGTIARVDIVKMDIRGEGATVIDNIIYKDGSSKNDDSNQLVMENGSWKLTGQ